MEFHVIIPARYASTRLPGKPLLDLAGKSMIQRVYERAQASGAHSVVIATDDQRVYQTAMGFGAQVCMTSAAHQSGTDRLAEVVASKHFANDTIIVNVQGDEPLIPPALIQQVASNLATRPNAGMATLYEPINDAEELFDPHAVKVVFDREGYALYFSRAPIPWDRDNFTTKTIPPALHLKQNYFRHIGLYAYRAGFLSQYSALPACEMEASEGLEQLRVLWSGYKIHIAQAVEKSPGGVDTVADVIRVTALLQR